MLPAAARRLVDVRAHRHERPACAMLYGCYVAAKHSLYHAHPQIMVPLAARPLIRYELCVGVRVRQFRLEQVQTKDSATGAVTATTPSLTAEYVLGRVQVGQNKNHGGGDGGSDGGRAGVGNGAAVGASAAAQLAAAREAGGSSRLTAEQAALQGGRLLTDAEFPENSYYEVELNGGTRCGGESPEAAALARASPPSAWRASPRRPAPRPSPTARRRALRASSARRAIVRHARPGSIPSKA